MHDDTGDGHAFEDVFRELAHPLARYLERLAGDHSVAEDLLQESYIRIARGLPDFEGRSGLKTWAFAVATHVAMDHFRKAGRAPTQVDESAAAELPDSAPTPEQRLTLDQMNACVREVVAELPPDYRAAILLHDFGGLSARETAAACGCSEATAKVRIHRARAKLKEALQRECTFYREEDNVLRCHRRD